MQAKVSLRLGAKGHMKKQLWVCVGRSKWIHFMSCIPSWPLFRITVVMNFDLLLWQQLRVYLYILCISHGYRKMILSLHNLCSITGPLPLIGHSLALSHHSDSKWSRFKHTGQQLSFWTALCLLLSISDVAPMWAVLTNTKQAWKVSAAGPYFDL